MSARCPPESGHLNAAHWVSAAESSASANRPAERTEMLTWRAATLDNDPIDATLNAA